MSAFIIIKWTVVLLAIAYLVYVHMVEGNQSTGDSMGPALLWLFKQLLIVLLIILWIIFFRKY